jgi:histidine triad (HIT) family protein
MNSCIFCKIITGSVKANVVHEDSDVLAFRDVNPQAPVHILIIPKNHIERVSSLTDKDLSIVASIHRVAQLLARSENIEQDGFRLVTNNGRNGGQSVDHLHYHLLGGRHFAWPPG